MRYRLHNLHGTGVISYGALQCFLVVPVNESLSGFGIKKITGHGLVQ